MFLNRQWRFYSIKPFKNQYGRMGSNYVVDIIQIHQCKALRPNTNAPWFVTNLSHLRIFSLTISNLSSSIPERMPESNRFLLGTYNRTPFPCWFLIIVMHLIDVFRKCLHKCESICKEKYISVALVEIQQEYHLDVVVCMCANTVRTNILLIIRVLEMNVDV